MISYYSAVFVSALLLLGLLQYAFRKGSSIQKKLVLKVVGLTTGIAFLLPTLLNMFTMLQTGILMAALAALTGAFVPVIELLPAKMLKSENNHVKVNEKLTPDEVSEVIKEYIPEEICEDKEDAIIHKKVEHEEAVPEVGNNDEEIAGEDIISEEDVHVEDAIGVTEIEIVSEEIVSEEDTTEEVESVVVMSEDIVSTEDEVEESVTEETISIDEDIIEEIEPDEDNEEIARTEETVEEEVTEEETVEEEVTEEDTVEEEVTEVTEEETIEDVVSEEEVTEDTIEEVASEEIINEAETIEEEVVNEAETIEEEVVSEEIVSEEIVSEEIVSEEETIDKVMSEQDDIEDVLSEEVVSGAIESDEELMELPEIAADTHEDKVVEKYSGSLVLPETFSETMAEIMLMNGYLALQENGEDEALDSFMMVCQRAEVTDQRIMAYMELKLLLPEAGRMMELINLCDEILEGKVELTSLQKEYIEKHTHYLKRLVSLLNAHGIPVEQPYSALPDELKEMAMTYQK